MKTPNESAELTHEQAMTDRERPAFEVGQTVKAKTDIWEPASEDGPAGYYARSGDFLEIVEIHPTSYHYRYAVRHHGAKGSFCAHEHELVQTFFKPKSEAANLSKPND